VTTSFAPSFDPPSLVVASPPLPSPAASGFVSSLELDPHARSSADAKERSRFM
jgi:hypothetical protein